MQEMKKQLLNEHENLENNSKIQHHQQCKKSNNGVYRVNNIVSETIAGFRYFLLETF